MNGLYNRYIDLEDNRQVNKEMESPYTSYRRQEIAINCTE